MTLTFYQCLFRKINAELIIYVLALMKINAKLIIYVLAFMKINAELIIYVLAFMKINTELIIIYVLTLCFSSFSHLRRRLDGRNQRGQCFGCFLTYMYVASTSFRLNFIH